MKTWLSSHWQIITFMQNQLRFFSSSNLLVRSSKSTSSLVNEVRPTLFVGILGKLGRSGSSRQSGNVWLGSADAADGGGRGEWD